MTTKLTLDALEVIDSIERKGSFAAAAAALYRVPSAVTYTVQKLEEDLGVTLFRKEGRRSVLTPAGKALLTQGRDLLQAAERLVETTRQVDRGWESCLNIAIDSVFTFDVIYPHLQEFYELQPDIEVNLYEEVLGGSWEAITEGRVDLVLGAPEPPGNTQGLQYSEMCEIEWLFCVAKGHPLTKLPLPISNEAIQEFRAIVVRDSSQQLPPLTRRVLDEQAHLRVASVNQKIEAQRQGLGVGFLPQNRIQSLLSKGELVSLVPDCDRVIAPVHMVWKTNNKGKAFRWFLERLQAR